MYNLPAVGCYLKFCGILAVFIHNEYDGKSWILLNSAKFDFIMLNVFPLIKIIRGACSLRSDISGRGKPESV